VRARKTLHKYIKDKFINILYLIELEMSLEKFITTLWNDDGKKFQDIEKLSKLLDRLKKQENEIYILSVQSNL